MLYHTELWFTIKDSARQSCVDGLWEARGEHEAVAKALAATTQHVRDHLTATRCLPYDAWKPAQSPAGYRQG